MGKWGIVRSEWVRGDQNRENRILFAGEGRETLAGKVTFGPCEGAVSRLIEGYEGHREYDFDGEFGAGLVVRVH